MAELIVVTREGEEKTFEADDGLSVMEVIRDGGVDELLALCGGCCSCATCHVYVEGPDLSRLPAMKADEDGLLEGLEHRSSRSRLSCQLRFGADLDGLCVQVAPEE